MQAILDATERLLEDAGVGELTTAKIAERAGVSAATVYLYFPNKNAVLYGLLERWLGFVNEALVQLSERRAYANWMEWVDALIDVILAVYEREPGLAKHYTTITAIPQLRALDAAQDEHVIAQQKKTLRHFFPEADETDLDVVSSLSPTIIHNVLKKAVNLPTAQKKKALKLLKTVVYTLMTNISS